MKEKAGPAKEKGLNQNCKVVDGLESAEKKRQEGKRIGMGIDIEYKLACESPSRIWCLDPPSE